MPARVRHDPVPRQAAINDTQIVYETLVHTVARLLADPAREH